MRVVRSRSVGTKVTEDQYQQFARLAGSDTISDWARRVLLAATQYDPIHVCLLAELLALRRIVLNLMFASTAREPITEQAVRDMINQADEEKYARAHERLASGIPNKLTRRT